MINLTLNQRKPRLFLTVVGMCLFLGGATQPSYAANRQPLLQANKQTIYQRVLTRPEATLAKQAGGKGESVPAFSRFYVYAEKKVGSSNWLEVGSDSKGNVVGWVEESQTVPWKHQLILSFDNPSGRNPVLFFEKREDLDQIVESDDPGKQVEPIYTALKSNQSDPRIVAKESNDYVDINKNFYLLPILESEEVYSGTGRTVRLMKIASVTKQDQPNPQSATPKQAAQLLRGFRAAVVFVIDSTISMGPYIERTKEAVKRIYNRIDEAGMNDKIDFGLIAYRSNLDAAPGLEYVTKTYVKPGDVKDAQTFLQKVSDLKPAKVSSGDQFDEDAYSGLKKALDEVQWNNYGARYIVLISDAGAISGDSPLSGTGLDASEIKIMAEEAGVATYSFHLQTSQGKANHSSAKQQYQQLTSNKLTNSPLYFPVDLGSVDKFGNIVDQLSESIVAQVEAASKGKKVAGSALSAAPDYTAPASEQKSATDDIDRLTQSVAAMSHAMQLAYIGRLNQSQAPSVIQAWVTDVDLEKPTRTAFDVRVLLTKNQLSDMQMVMKGILDASMQGITKPETFYKNLQSFAAQLGRDPNQIADESSMKIADLGLMDEYLSDLPYKSDLMNLTQDRWQTLSAQDQLEITNRIRRKLNYYQIYNSDSGRWISLAPDTPEGEKVYPVPFDALP